MSKIALVSRLVQLLLVAIAMLQLTAYFLVVFFGEIQGAGRQFNIQLGFISSYLRIDFNHSWKSIAAALEAEKFNSTAILGLAELVPYIFIYYFIFRLFGLYKAGIIFTDTNIRCLKYVSFTLLNWVFLNLLYPLLVTLVIRLSGASQALKFHLNFGIQELTYLLLGLVIYVIAWTMNEAMVLKHQQELVI